MFCILFGRYQNKKYEKYFIGVALLDSLMTAIEVQTNRSSFHLGTCIYFDVSI